MNELSEWLDSWRPIRSGFEQLSLANPAVVLCCWPGELERLNDFRSPEQHVLLGMAAYERLGLNFWWLLHEGLARAAQSSMYDHLPIGEELNRANRVRTDFKNHADHAGNLLAQVPRDAPFGFSEAQRGRKLWIERLFGEAVLPFSRIQTQHYLPIWATVLERPWPYGILTLAENPFAASVVLVDIIRDAVTNRNAMDPALPEVDLGTNQVRYCGRCHDVSGDGALLVSKLVDSYPHFFSASKLFSKPSRIKDNLPEPLKALIVAETGKGYRLHLG